jgi:hypothetical protein
MELAILCVAIWISIATGIIIRLLIDIRQHVIHQEPIKTPHKAKIKPTEQTDEQRQYNTLMSNIDNYNGTGAKQEKVR